MGRRHYCWTAVVAASIALAAGCTGQTTSHKGGQPLGGRWWVTTSPPPPGMATAGETSAGPSIAEAELPNRSASAYRQFTEAVTQNPVSQAVGGAVGRSAAWVKTRTAKLRQPQVTGAEDTISLSHKSPPPGASLYVAMARLHEQGGNMEQAVVLYEKALDKEPDSLEASLGLAHLLDREGRFDVAIEQYRKAIRTHPNDSTAHNDLGLCYARNGDMDDAITELTQAVTLRPHSKLYRNNLATVLVEQGRNDEALEHLTAAHGKGVDHYNLGVLLHQRGRDDQAIEQFATALQVNPKLEPARTWLARLDRSSAPNVPLPAGPGSLASEGRGEQLGLRGPTGPQGAPTGPRLGPVVGIDPMQGPTATGIARARNVPATRPVYPETWRSQATGDAPVHLPALRGPEQAVLPPTPDDLQRYPTSVLPNGPRSY